MQVVVVQEVLEPLLVFLYQSELMLLQLVLVEQEDQTLLV